MNEEANNILPTEAILLRSIIELSKNRSNSFTRATVIRHAVKHHWNTYKQVRTRAGGKNRDGDIMRKHSYTLLKNLIEEKYLREKDDKIMIDHEALSSAMWSKKGDRTVNQVLGRLRKRVDRILEDPERAIKRARLVTQARRRRKAKPALSVKERDKNFKQQLKELKDLYKSEPETTYRDVEHAVSMLRIRTGRP